MKLKVKDMDIETGGPLVVIINRKDAEKFDLHVLDRVKVYFNNKIETVAVDIAESRKAVKPGHIGVFEEVIDSLGLKHGDIVGIAPARKPMSVRFIKKKLDGGRLNKKEIDQIVWDIVHNKLSDVELTYFVAACYANQMDSEETIMLTEAMAKQGDSLKLDRYPVVDKHSIGGIAGNRTTMIVVPIIAAANLTMPKTSSRSITSPAGTADTMEVLAKVVFPIKKMKEIIMKTNACIVWGGALNLAPADDKIIKVERPLNIDAESQLIASIMAKKQSVSSTHILIDIPVGESAKVKNRPEALRLKKSFKHLGRKLGKKIKVIITDGTQPIGNGIGPALEARDVLYILSRDGKRPLDLEKKSVMMAAEIFKLVGMKNPYNTALEMLNSGKAYKKMEEIIKAQNGDPHIKPSSIKLGRFRLTLKAKKSGTIKKINNDAICHIARVAGAPEAKGAGIYLYVHKGCNIKKEDKLMTIYSQSQIKLKYAAETIKAIDGIVIK